ncbi:MAG TPA: proline dehydrogenase family protein [Longimicrobiales bacterium]|nr:proline dehydrogenase family protein [Longimicrobiales bacterium]
MAIARKLLLKASESRWLADNLPNYPFARRAVKRFMPGESVEDALSECATLQQRKLSSVITRLGENIQQLDQAAEVTAHYVDVLNTIKRRGLQTHVSVKLTQLGLDMDADHALESVVRIMRSAAPDPVWIDIESSRYTDITLEVFRSARATGTNVGLCLQAYLKRTEKDLEDLLATTTAIRLVKGAYREPPEIAYARKADVDDNYVKLARMLLDRAKTGEIGHAPAFATHDREIIGKLAIMADELGVTKQQFEYQMLYGINASEQNLLATEGFRTRVLISYGEAWFAWYMRRLAERPANLWFVVKSVF